MYVAKIEWMISLTRCFSFMQIAHTFCWETKFASLRQKFLSATVAGLPAEIMSRVITIQINTYRPYKVGVRLLIVILSN